MEEDKLRIIIKKWFEEKIEEAPKGKEPSEKLLKMVKENARKRENQKVFSFGMKWIPVGVALLVIIGIGIGFYLHDTGRKSVENANQYKASNSDNKNRKTIVSTKKQEALKTNIKKEPTEEESQSNTEIVDETKSQEPIIVATAKKVEDYSNVKSLSESSLLKSLIFKYKKQNSTEVQKIDIMNNQEELTLVNKDEYSINIQATEAVFIYIYQVNDSGAFKLFPTTKHKIKNPISGELNMPFDDMISLSGNNGEEEIYIFVSKQKEDMLGNLITKYQVLKQAQAIDSSLELWKFSFRHE